MLEVAGLIRRVTLGWPAHRLLVRPGERSAPRGGLRCPAPAGSL